MTPLQENNRYHIVAMSLHWVIALLILANLTTGLLFDDMERPARFFYMQLHKSFGICVILFTLVRIAWRLGYGAPAEPDYLKPWERVASSAVHFLLYVFMLAIPLSGWALVSASPLHIPTVLFWTIPWPNLPYLDGAADQKAFAHQIGDIHAWLAYGMIGLLFLHVAAALKHHWMAKDTILFRMTPRWAEGFLRLLRGEK